MEAIQFKWPLVLIVVMLTANGIEGSCLTFSRQSCIQGDKRGLSANSPETRLIPEMEINCTGTLVGWTVSGRRGSGTMYPKLQIWRRSNTDANLYFKNGAEIQIDAQGSACETLTRNVNCNQEFYCRLSPANYLSVLSGSDIIGVELPSLQNQAFELLFIVTEQQQYVWRQRVTSSSLRIGNHDVRVGDDLLFSVDVLDTDECLVNTDNCDQICTNTIGSFQCSCIDGYTLSSDKQTCLDVDECTAGTHNCQQHCVNINGGFSCGCNSGYLLKSDWRTCSDINECSLNTTNWCDQLCINTNGSFRCSCNAGFSLSSNGRSCLDINECTSDTHNCQQHCININGGFSCDCDSGYQLNFDGRTCSDINECSSNATNLCDQLCINTNGSFRCGCNAGYTLSSNGRSCLDINECTAGAHNCQQRCININGGFSCDCDSGYQLNFDQNSCSEIKVNGELSCTIKEAIVGGAIGTPMLFTILCLVVALVYAIKKKQRKPNRWDQAITSTQTTDIHMAKLSSDVVKGKEEISLSESPYMYENDNIYSTIQDEDKVTSANEDEYIEMNPTNI